MAKVIVFGTRDNAALAHVYLSTDSNHEVVAFAVHEKYRGQSTSFRGLPLEVFEEIEHKYPPGEFVFFAPIGPADMNRTRQEICTQIERKGYAFISYVSSRATVLPESKIGTNCFIFENNVIQPFAEVGDHSILWSGNHLGHHSRLSNYVMLTSHVVVSGHCDIGSHCYFGVNSAVRDGLKIAEGTLVGMCAAVIHDTESWSVYVGSPARKLGKKSWESLPG